MLTATESANAPNSDGTSLADCWSHMRALTTTGLLVLVLTIAACGSSGETSDAAGIGGAGGGAAGAGGSGGGGVAGGGGTVAGAGGGVAGAGGGVAGAGGGMAGGGGGVAGAGGGVAGTGGGGGAGGGNQACVSATLNGTCSTEGMTCGGESCTNACQFCNILRCTTGHWQRVESFPAPCFACGTGTLRCQANAEYCYSIMGGALGTQPSYTCLAVPAACRPTPTCTCLQGEHIPGSCTQAGAGELLISLAAP